MFIVERLEDTAKKAEKKRNDTPVILFKEMAEITDGSLVDILRLFFFFKFNHSFTFLRIPIPIPTMELYRLKKKRKKIAGIGRTG